MTVYVDDMYCKKGNIVFCHMVADSHTELLEMAALINLQWRWIQHEGTPQEHFDVGLGMRDKAVRHGAVEITMRECAAMCARRRETGVLGQPGDAWQWLKDHMEAQRAKALAGKGKRRRKAA